MTFPSPPLSMEEWIEDWIKVLQRMAGQNPSAVHALHHLLLQRQISALHRLRDLEFSPEDTGALYRIARCDGVRLVEILALWSDKRLRVIRAWSGKHEEGGPDA